MEKDDLNFYNIVGQNNIKMKFTIPVGNISREDAEKSLKELLSSYKEDIDEIEDYPDFPDVPPVKIKKDYFFPSRSNDFLTQEDIWNELSASEKAERLLPKEEQDEIFKKTGFVDWNQYDLDYLADYLENKYRFNSSGDALAIHKLIEFYRTHK